MKPGQHRETARVLLRKPSGEIFLLLTHFDPEVGLPPRWLTPGGGIDEGETPLEAAIRELSEETGLIVSPELLEGPLWRFEGRWEGPMG
jgi:8-oxo-dGTP pyrophosphatase MutT (NUDIX family)